MKLSSFTKSTKFVRFTAVAFAAVSLTACDVDKTQDGEMPEVTVEGGEMPAYDVDVAEVEVGTVEKTMEVPQVEMVEETVTVPAVGVDMPEEDGPGPAADAYDRE